MAVKIRLKRMGSKKRPFYRLVVADSRNAASSGRIIESIGTYNPVSQPKEVEINEEAALKWMHEGAKPSDTVRKLFSDRGIMEKFHNEKHNK